MKQHIILLYSAMHDSRTPWYAKLLVVLTLCYILSPIDLIPDFIPVLGLLDEVLLLPLALALIFQLIPRSVKDKVEEVEIDGEASKKLSGYGASLVFASWLLTLICCLWLFQTAAY